MDSSDTFAADYHMLVFGEINLDAYIEISSRSVSSPESVLPSTASFKTGGNTWNIARLLALLGRRVTFLCTSNERDISIAVLQEESTSAELELLYIPGMITRAPRFIAIDQGADPVLRTIHFPTQYPPTVEQACAGYSGHLFA